MAAACQPLLSRAAGCGYTDCVASAKRQRFDPVGGKHRGVLLSVRVDEKMREAVRAHRVRLQALAVYRQVSDSDAVRDLLVLGLAAVTKPAKRR